MSDETRVMLKLPGERVGELWQTGRQRLIDLNEEYQRTQREAFEKAVVLNVEASSARGRSPIYSTRKTRALLSLTRST